MYSAPFFNVSVGLPSIIRSKIRPNQSTHAAARTGTTTVLHAKLRPNQRDPPLEAARGAASTALKVARAATMNRRGDIFLSSLHIRRTAVVVAAPVHAEEQRHTAKDVWVVRVHGLEFRYPIHTLGHDRYAVSLAKNPALTPERRVQIPWSVVCWTDI